MGSVNKGKALNLENKIKRLYPGYEELKTKIEAGDKLDEKETAKYTTLQEQLIKHVDETTKESLKFVDPSILVKVNSIVETKSNNRILFTYQPKTTSNNLIVLTSSEVKSQVVTGENKKFKGLSDDLMSFTYQPTLQILGRNDLTKNWKPIYHNTEAMNSDYTISCSFRLNRFPTRTWYKSVDSTYQTNTTRRTEIIKFKYAEGIDTGEGAMFYKDQPHNFISIGAVAPYDRKRYTMDNYQNRFNEKLSPFSIGVSFPLGAGQQTIYTDYKFNLKTWYNLRIKVSKRGDWENTYTVSLYVNDVLERTLKANFILWGRKSNDHRKYPIYNYGELLSNPRQWFSTNQHLLVASAPGFEHSSRETSINELIREKVTDVQYINSYTNKIDSVPKLYQDFNFNTLYKILTPPYYSDKHMSFLNYPLEPKNNNHWNHHKQKMNTGIDYGDITISMK